MPFVFRQMQRLTRGRCASAQDRSELGAPRREAIMLIWGDEEE